MIAHSDSYDEDDDVNLLVVEWENEYGEWMELQIDVPRRIGTLRGEDIGEHRIAKGRIQSDELILSEEEFEWVAKTWKEETGEKLKPLRSAHFLHSVMVRMAAKMAAEQSE